MTTSLDRDVLMPQHRRRAQTRENRATTINLLPGVPPEYKFVEKYNIVSVSGEWGMYGVSCEECVGD